MGRKVPVLVAVVMVAAGLAFSAWVWFGRAEPKQSSAPFGSTPSPTTTAAGSPTTVQPDDNGRRVNRRNYAVGDCVTWAPREGLTKAQVVDCGEDHRLQVAGRVTLDDYRGRKGYPAPDEWRTLIEQRCTPVVVGAVGGPVDPNGRYGISATTPSPESWADADRTLWCGVVSSERDPSDPAESGLLNGGVDLSNQQIRRPVGQCLAISPDGVRTPVDCGQPHQVEVVGQATLPDGGPYPGDEAVSRSCEPIASGYVGDRSFNYGYIEFDERSWATGRRTFVCVVGQPGDVFGWATRTGSLRG